MGNLPAKHPFRHDFSSVHFLLLSDPVQVAATSGPKEKKQNRQTHFHSHDRFLCRVGTVQRSDISQVIAFGVPAHFEFITDVRTLQNRNRSELCLLHQPALRLLPLLPQPVVLRVYGRKIQNAFEENAEELWSQQQQQQHPQQTKPTHDHVSNERGGVFYVVNSVKEVKPHQQKKKN